MYNQPSMNFSHNKNRITQTIEFIKSLVSKHPLVFLFFTITLIAGYVYRDFISLQYSFIFRDVGCDTITTFYPQLVCISDYLRNYGIPSWSFEQGLGQNMFPFSMGEPFNVLLYLVGKSAISYSIVFVELLKIFLIAFFSYLFFQKLKLSKYVSIIGACMVSFCGFVVLGGTWYIFSTEALYFVFLLYGFECLYQNKNWYIFPIAIFLIASYQPFNVFLFGCFLILFAAMRMAIDDNFTVYKFKSLLIKFCILGIIGLGLSAVFLLPEINQLLHSPRVGGNVSRFSKLMNTGLQHASKTQYGTTLARLFSSDMLGSGPEYRGWRNYLEAPLFYMSLPLLLLLPQAFFNVNARKKIVYALLITFLLVTINFPLLRYSFWLFSGDYYRFYSFGIMFLFLTITLISFNNILQNIKINIVTLIATLFVLIFAITITSKLNVTPIQSTKSTVIVLLCIYTLFCILLNYKRTQFAGKILLFTTLCFELGYMANKTVNNRIRIKNEEFKQDKGYNDHTNAAIQYLKEKDKSFYRVYKIYFSERTNLYTSLNESKVQHFNGGTSYSSFNQLQYVSFFQEMGAISKTKETESRWCIGYRNRPILQLLCNVKYIITRCPVSPFITQMSDSLTTIKNITIRKNKFFMPLGITYDSYMLKADYEKLSIIKRDNALLKCIIVDTANKLTNGFTKLDSNSILNTLNINQLKIDVDNRKKDTLAIHYQSNTLIKGTISVATKKILFFAIPNDEGWHVTVDEKKQKTTTVMGGLMAIELQKGKHMVQLEYIKPFFNIGIIISLCFLFIFIALILIPKRKLQKV